MSGTFKFKRIYSEGVAAEHPDIAGQKEFANRADAEITRRRKERAKKGGPQLPGFVASVKKEEVELGEGIQPLPGKKMLWKIKMKSLRAQNAMDFRRDNRDYSKGEMGERLKNMVKGKIEKISPQIKKMKTKMRNHDPIESRFKELENRDRGEKNL